MMKTLALKKVNLHLKKSDYINNLLMQLGALEKQEKAKGQISRCNVIVRT